MAVNVYLKTLVLELCDSSPASLLHVSHLRLCLYPAIIQKDSSCEITLRYAIFLMAIWFCRFITSFILNFSLLYNLVTSSSHLAMV
jgi:hypothetical protein